MKNFNLDIQSNTTVALVGASGSGKSTVLCLLERFYDVSSGKITIDGNDIRDLDPVYLHRILAIVPQEPVLFSGSIRSNILSVFILGETNLSLDILNLPPILMVPFLRSLRKISSLLPNSPMPTTLSCLFRMDMILL